MIDHPKQLAYLLTSKDQNFFAARSQANNLFQGSKAVKNENTINFVNDLLASGKLVSVMKTNFLTKLEAEFKDWLLAHNTNTILGFDQFNASFSTGTTQAFDSFYFRHRACRFRCLVGEYFYHLKTWQAESVNWNFITDDDPVVAGDAVVISAPFCDTGSLHPQHTELIKHCEQLGIPVLIDSCYYTISGGLDIDLNYSCIDTIAFSLSKAFPVSLMRIGMRYTRKDIFDGQSLHSSISYNNALSAAIGIEIINAFGADYIYNTYLDKQQEVCNTLPGLTASTCSLFAVGDDRWRQYSRATLLNSYKLDFDPKLFANRICLNPIYENWDLWNLYKNEYSADF